MKGKPIPTMGFPTRTDAVLALFDKGKKAPEIADHLGIDVKTVYSLKSAGFKSAKRKGTLPAKVPEHIMGLLKPHADKRKITGETLVLRLLKTIIADDMVDAVLDDEVAS